MPATWADLGKQLERRLIRVIDVASILIFDSVLLLLGYALTWVASRYATKTEVVYEYAKTVAHGTFLLLYVSWVVVDLWDFYRQTYLSGRG